jgi:hypothetical protein
MTISNRFNYSLRDIGVFIANLEVFLIENSDNISLCPDQSKTLFIYFYFLLLKNKYIVDYINIIHGDFLMEEKKDSHLKIIDQQFIINDEIKGLLTDICDGRALKYDPSIFGKYHMFSDSDKNVFTKHMFTYLK